jgi:hypothetical protein
MLPFVFFPKKGCQILGSKVIYLGKTLLSNCIFRMVFSFTQFGVLFNLLFLKSTMKEELYDLTL